MRFKPLLYLLLFPALLSLASCGGSMTVTNGQLVGQAALPFDSPRTSDQALILPLSDGGVVTVGTKESDVIIVDRFNSKLENMWHLQVPSEDQFADMLSIHEWNNKLVIPVFYEKEGEAQDEDRLIYAYHSIDLNGTVAGFSELDSRTEDDQCFGAPGVNNPKATGFRRDGIEVVKGDPRLVFSPSRKYCISYYSGELTTDMKSLDVSISVFDRNLKSVRREKLKVAMEQDEVLSGVRVDDEGGVIVLIEKEVSGSWFSKFIDALSASTADDKVPDQAVGIVKAIRYTQNVTPQELIIGLGLPEMYSVTKEVGQDGKLYVAALNADGDELMGLAVGIADFKSGKVTRAVTKIEEEELEKMLDNDEFENAVLDKLYIDHARNRIVMVLEEAGSETTTRQVSYQQTNYATGKSETKWKSKTSKRYFCGNLLLLGFDLQGKNLWKQGIEKRQEAPGQDGYIAIGYQADVTPEGTLALWYAEEGLEFREFDITTGARVVEKQVAEFEGAFYFMPALTAVLPNRQVIAVGQLGMATNDAAIFKINAK